MHEWYQGLMIGQIAEQVLGLIKAAAAKGWTMLREFKDIRKALFQGRGHVFLRHGKVLAYAEIEEKEKMFILRSVVVADGYQGQNLGKQIVANRIKYAFAINPDKPINLICHKGIIKFYRKIGFIKQAKRCLPVTLYGKRTKTEWQKCDRVWMTIASKACHDNWRKKKSKQA